MLGAAISIGIMYEPGGTGPDQAPDICEVRCTFIDELPNAEVRTGVRPAWEYLVLVAHFLRGEDAQVMRAELIMKDMPVDISSKPRDSGGAWHRVAVGPYASKIDARNALDRLGDGDFFAAQILVRPAARQMDLENQAGSSRR